MPPLTRRRLLSTSLAATTSTLVLAESEPKPSEKRDWHATGFRRMVALGESTTAGGWSTNA